MGHQDLVALIEAVDGTAQAISALALSASSSAPNELVGARRKLAQQGLQMSRAVDEQLTGPLSRHSSHIAAELRAAYATRTNRARTEIALHQAKWPAIEMRNSIAGYQADVKRLHVEQQAYRAWLKNEFIPQASELLSRGV